jgi:hypothetical protein
MLVHIVCWKYKPEVEAASRSAHRAKLAGLRDVIDSVVTLKVGEDILHLDRSFDTGLVATFADEAALDAYTVHPDHQKVAALGRELAEKVISVDFLT